MKYSLPSLSSLLILLLTADNHCLRVAAIEPISTAATLGVAAVGAGVLAGYEYMTCLYRECCSDRWITKDVDSMRFRLEQHVFGQHIAIDAVTGAIKAHFHLQTPSKALTMSFHGWTGVGKNYVARIMAESILARGTRSQYFHLIPASIYFSDPGKVDAYQEQLKDWIRTNVTACATNIFVFDEVDKIPSNVLNALAPFLEFYEGINGVDYRHSVFLFLSNVGGTEIINRVKQNWQAGLARESLTLDDFEPLIEKIAFNKLDEERGGFYHSAVISKGLIGHYIPFLPM